MSQKQIGELVTVEREGTIATVTIDRGDGLNALSRQLIIELTDVARSFASDLETRAVVLSGKGVFISGADLRDPALARGSAGLLEWRNSLKIGPDLCDAWANIEQVTILAIEKQCIGGGAALAVACDFRIVGESAFFWLPEILLGMNMSWHAIPRLVSLIGPARTKRLAIFGEKIEARKALAWGLIDEVTQDGQTLSVAEEWASRIAKLPPNAVRMTKQSVGVAANSLSHAVSYMDLDQFALAATSEDFLEAVGAFFQGREPKYTGR